MLGEVFMKLNYIYILILSFCISTIQAVEKPEEQTLEIDESVAFESYDGPIVLNFKTNISYVMNPKGTIERQKAMPFRGVYLRPKNKVYSVNNTWFEERVTSIIEYCQNTAKVEDLFNPEDEKDTGKALACKAFYDDLAPIVGQKGEIDQLESLKKKMVDEYIKTALVYAYKYNNQKKAKAAPKFGSLTKVLQPLMTSFAYINPWIAVAECYESSEAIKKGKEIFRGFFLNKNLMMVLRRRLQFPFSENRLDWSMLNMDQDTFKAYHSECIRTWLDSNQYITTYKIETKKKG